MSNVSGRAAIEMANEIFGICPEAGLLNILFEIFDGELVVETIDGDSGVDFSDMSRLRLLMGCAVFGDKSAKLSQTFQHLDDGPEAVERFNELIDGLTGVERDEGVVAQAVNAHPALRTLVVFTLEQGADGSRAYRLYRNPNVEREVAIGSLRSMREEFRARRAANASDTPKN